MLLPSVLERVVRVCVHMCSHLGHMDIWRWEVSCRCSLGAVLLGFVVVWAESLTGLELSNWARLIDQQIPGIQCLHPPCHSPPPSTGLQEHANSPCFMCSLEMEPGLHLSCLCSTILRCWSFRQSSLCRYLLLLRMAEFLPDFPDQWEEIVQFSFINRIWLCWELGCFPGPWAELKPWNLWLLGTYHTWFLGLSRLLFLVGSSNMNTRLVWTPLFIYIWRALSFP